MSIKDKIYEIVSKRMKVKIEDLSGELGLKKDYGADSIDTVEIVFDIEEFWNISIEDSLAETINTIDDAVSVVEKLVN